MTGYYQFLDILNFVSIVHYFLMQTNKGRTSLTPENFSRECVLEMNLGPLHLLGPLVTEVYHRFNKEFSYKRKASGVFVSTGLSEYELGAAIQNRRKKKRKEDFLSTFGKTL